MSLYKNALLVIRDRWQYFLLGYIAGYIASLKMTGIPNVIYLIPIKLPSIILSIIMGIAVYNAIGCESYLKSLYKSIKPLIIIFLIFAITMVLYKVLNQNFNIDISPFVGL